MALSSLARGYGSWTGNLELDPNLEPKKGKLQGPTLFPCIPADEPHKHGITVTPRARSSTSAYTYSSKTNEKQDGEIVLPKTYLTKKGAILLFSAPETLDLDLTENEKKILRKRMRKKDVVSDMVKKIGTMDRLSKSVLMFGDENYSADTASISDEENRVFLKFIHNLDKKMDLKSQPGANLLNYLTHLKSPNGSRLSRVNNAVADDRELTEILKEMDKLIFSSPGGTTERLSADASKLTEQYTRPVTSMTVRVSDDNRLASATSSRSYRVLSTDRLRASLKSSGYQSLQPAPPTSSALKRPVSTGESITYLSTYTPYGYTPSRPPSSPPQQSDSPRSRTRSIHLSLQQHKKGEEASHGDSISIDDNDLYSQQLLHESDKYALHDSNTFSEIDDRQRRANPISSDDPPPPPVSRPDMHAEVRDIVEGQVDVDLDVASIATSLLEEEDINLPSEDEDSREHRPRRQSSAKSSIGKSTALPSVEQILEDGNAEVLQPEGAAEGDDTDEVADDITDYHDTSDAAKPLVPPYDAMGFLNGPAGAFSTAEDEANAQVHIDTELASPNQERCESHNSADQIRENSHEISASSPSKPSDTSPNPDDIIIERYDPHTDVQQAFEENKSEELTDGKTDSSAKITPEGAADREVFSQPSSKDINSPVLKTSPSRPVSGVSSSRGSSVSIPQDPDEKESGDDFPLDGPAVLSHPKESSIKTTTTAKEIPTEQPAVQYQVNDTKANDETNREASNVDQLSNSVKETPSKEDKRIDRTESVSSETMNRQVPTPLTTIKEEEKIPDKKTPAVNDTKMTLPEKKSTSPVPKPVEKSSFQDISVSKTEEVSRAPVSAKKPVAVPPSLPVKPAKSPVEKKTVEKPVKSATPTIPKSVNERRPSRGSNTTKPTNVTDTTKAKKKETSKSPGKKSENQKQYTKVLDISSIATPEKEPAKPSSPAYRLLEDDDDIITPVRKPNLVTKEPEPTISQEEIEKKLRLKELEEERLRQQQEAEAIAKLEAEVTKVFDEGVADTGEDDDEDGGMTAEELQLQKQLLQEKLEQAERKLKGEEDKPPPKTKAKREIKKKGRKEKKTDEQTRDVVAEREALREAKRAERERRAAEARELEEKIREQEEQKRRAEINADRKKKDLEEEMQDLKDQADEAMQMEEDARQQLAAVRKAAKEEREMKRKAEIERKKSEMKQAKEQQRKQMENARRREKEMLERIASADQKKRMQEEERRQREEEDRLLAEKLAEQERLAIQAAEEEEERIAELERQAEEEAMARLVAEREEADKRRRQLMREKEEMEEAEERKRQAMLEEQRRLEEERRLQQEAEERRKEEERQRLIELQRMEAEAREKMKAEIEKRREEALKRREKNLERRGNLDCLRNKQGLTKPWIFSYYVLWPRETYERLMGEDPKKKKGFRPKPKPKKKKVPTATLR